MSMPAIASSPGGYDAEAAHQSHPVERRTPVPQTLPSPRRGTLQEQIDDLRATLNALCTEVLRATAGREGSRPVLTVLPGGKS